MGILRIHKEIEVGNVTWVDDIYDSPKVQVDIKRNRRSDDETQMIEDPLLTALYVGLFDNQTSEG